ncbi:MAG: DNA ligase [Acidimicrobiales bacterium]
MPLDPAAYQLEPKFDGQRLLVTIDDGVVRLANRAGRDTTGVYPELAGLGVALGRGRAAVLDGEVVAGDATGHPSFQRLQQRMHVGAPSARLLTDVPVVFAAFDVLWLDGDLLTGRPQCERRRILETLELRGPAWQTAPVLVATPEELMSACTQMGLEGFMAKRLDAPYHPGRRSAAWWKMKFGRRRDFVVGGWSPGRGSRSDTIGSLAVGCYDIGAAAGTDEGRVGRLFYVGQVGSGLTDDLIRALGDLFKKTALATSPFVNGGAVPRLSFVEPVLVVEVAYTEATLSGTLRQPVFKGLRTDVDASEVTVDDELAGRLGL